MPFETVTPRRDRLVRAARAAGGLALLAVGVPLLVLPGPGIPLLVGGLLLLERDFRWAARARKALTDLVGRAASGVKGKAAPTLRR